MEKGYLKRRNYHAVIMNLKSLFLRYKKEIYLSVLLK